MAWVKLDDAMPHHPKVMAAGPQAFALDVAGIAYCNRFGTDGFIADKSLPSVFPALSKPRLHARKLVEVGRWIRDEERGGWIVHDIDDYQPTSALRAEISEKRAKAGRLGGIESGKQRQTKPEATAKQSASTQTNPVPSRPVPKSKTLGVADATPKKSRPRDLIFEAVADVCGIDWHRMPANERGRVNTAAKQLRDIDATVDEIRAKASAYRRKWPEVELTPTALVSNWSQVQATTRPDLARCPDCQQPLGSAHNDDSCAFGMSLLAGGDR